MSDYAVSPSAESSANAIMIMLSWTKRRSDAEVDIR